MALLELPAALSEDHLAGRSPLPEALPLTSRLRTAFTLRIGALPGDTQAALLLAAAEDSDEASSVAAAIAVMGLEPDVLDPAEEVGLIDTTGGRLKFRHPLVRTAVYDSATRARRQSTHAALSEVHAEAGHASRSLWHRAIATDTRDEQLAGALEALAQQSSQRGGPASARVPSSVRQSSAKTSRRAAGVCQPLPRPPGTPARPIAPANCSAARC